MLISVVITIGMMLTLRYFFSADRVVDWALDNQALGLLHVFVDVYGSATVPKLLDEFDSEDPRRRRLAVSGLIKLKENEVLGADVLNPILCRRATMDDERIDVVEWCIRGIDTRDRSYDWSGPIRKALLSCEPEVIYAGRMGLFGMYPDDLNWFLQRVDASDLDRLLNPEIIDDVIELGDQQSTFILAGKLRDVPSSHSLAETVKRLRATQDGKRNIENTNNTTCRTRRADPVSSVD